MSSGDRVETVPSAVVEPGESASAVREIGWMECDACGEALRREDGQLPIARPLKLMQRLEDRGRGDDAVWIGCHHL